MQVRLWSIIFQTLFPQHQSTTIKILLIALTSFILLKVYNFICNIPLLIIFYIQQTANEKKTKKIKTYIWGNRWMAHPEKRNMNENITLTNDLYNKSSYICKECALYIYNSMQSVSRPLVRGCHENTHKHIEWRMAAE